MLRRGQFGSMFLALVLSLAVGATAFAAPQPVSRDGASKVIMDPSLADKLEREAAPAAREAARKAAALQETAEVSPDALPVPGDVRVMVRPWTSGYTYFDSEKRGAASTIWGYTLTIAGFFTEGVAAVILGVVSFVGEQASQVDQNKGATARLLHSYRYPEKQAEVYTNNRTWVTYYTAQPRQWFKHEYGSYVNTAGYTRSAARDFTPDLGYPPIRTESTTHYNDNRWLTNKALELYRERRAPQCEGFTYPCL